MRSTTSKTREPLSKDTVFTLCLMGITAVLVISTGIYYKQAFLRLLPLCVSLVIGFLQTKANRHAPLLIGINALLYGIAYLQYHLYASAAYAILVSCPLSLINYALWRKSPYKQSTIFRRMTAKQRVMWGGVAFVGWAAASYLFFRFQSDFNLLDTTVTVLGIFSTVLSLLSFMEFPFMTAATQFCSIFLHLSGVGSSPDKITYVIYSVYAFSCAVMAFFRTRKLYAEQQRAKAP